MIYFKQHNTKTQIILEIEKLSFKYLFATSRSHLSNMLFTLQQPGASLPLRSDLTHSRLACHATHMFNLEKLKIGTCVNNK